MCLGLISIASDSCHNLSAPRGSWGDCVAPLPGGACRRAVLTEAITSSTVSMHGAGNAPNMFAMRKMEDMGQEVTQGLTVCS